jgi:alkylation response protein AidB-like acyl-CoA dehydrogenase
MDFGWDERVERLRVRAREFLHTELPAELEESVYSSGVSHDPGFVAALARNGWIAPEWPQHGDQTLDPWEAHALTDELVRVEAPTVAITTTVMVARVIITAGSATLKAEIIPRVMRGEVTIALGMTEPEAGSDVAAVQTRARREERGWIIDGQKMFTTNGHIADFVFLLARTSPDKRRHAGLSTFLVPLDLPGIEVQAVRTLSGERTNILFFNGVRLDDRWRIGEVDGGWQALMIALQDEHSASFSPHLARLLDAVEEWAMVDDHSVRPIDDRDARVRLARWATALEVAELLEARVTWMDTRGEAPIAEGSMAKLFSTEALVHAAEDLTELVGPDALRSKLDPTALVDGKIEHALRFAVGTAIYGGTSEIQRNIVAQHACGLPR